MQIDNIVNETFCAKHLLVLTTFINSKNILKPKMETFTAVLNKEEDMFVAQCPEVGTTSQGKTIEEAIANLKEATELYKEEFSQYL